MDQYNVVLEQIQAKGERITIQRRLVLEVLCNHPNHLTIGNIQSRLPPNAELPETTIYRILQWLKELGIVSQTDMGSDGVAYQLLLKPHHHLICLSCGNVTELEDSIMLPLREKLLTENGFKARIDHMAIYGLCSVCNRSQSDLVSLK